MCNYQKAFTLAEVLITLGIIGIVAALTIPSLVKEYQEYSWKQAWKKEFSVLSQAYTMIKNNHGGDLSDYFLTTSNEAARPLLNEFVNYISVIKNCGYAEYVCGTQPHVDLTNNDVYKTLSGGYVHYHNLKYVQYVMKDGTNFYSRSYQPGYAIIWIDVNGYNKGPNTLGKDFFGVVFNENKFMPMGAMGSGLENTCNSNIKTCPSSYGFHSEGSCAGAGCSSEYLYK